MWIKQYKNCVTVDKFKKMKKCNFGWYLKKFIPHCCIMEKIMVILHIFCYNNVIGFYSKIIPSKLGLYFLFKDRF